MGYYPRHVEFSKDYDLLLMQVETNTNLSPEEKASRAEQIELAKEEERQEKSYIGMMGRFIEPVIRPLGFDWKIGMSIITGWQPKKL
jgi:ferrous iron transport protein B